MGNNDLSSSENILVKVDQNNLIYIDPNSVVNNGEVEPRNLKQENLMMYVNLEADLIPRSVLITEDKNKGTLVSIAKGTINMLRNNNDRDFDTSWTNTYTGFDEKVKGKGDTEFSNFEVRNIPNDGTGQSFGIESVDITTKGFNAIPTVTINFVDVRGKTLFESPQDSPYKAFFHLPWPIFYLTVKGYYGKAIRYRLHLVKFNTKFNESTGNFEITTNFVGSTYAYLNDIPINGVLNSPYMYLVESAKPSTYNEKTGKRDQVVSKSSKGYQILDSIFKEYRQKGLIDKNFPTKTLKEVIVVAQSLDKILEREIFDQLVDFKIFAGVKEYEKKLEEFENQVMAWGRANLSSDTFTGSINPIYYFLNGNRTEDKKIVGDTKTGTLEYIIKTNLKSLESTKGFTKELLNKTDAKFSDIKPKSYVSGDIKTYYKRGDGQSIGVAFDLLIQHIRKLITSFIAQRDILQKEVEEKINTVLKNPNKGIGFEPTIRNIFAVLLANAEVYIRLMKDVHNKAFENSKTRKEILTSLSDETPNVGAIYPWPEIKKNTGTGSKHKVIAYPGDRDLAESLQTNNYKLWPEVEFVENYIAIGTKKIDTLANKEGGAGSINFIFDSDIDESKVKKISTLNTLIYNLPYIDKSLSSILYEIYERSFYTTLVDTFDSKTLSELSSIEFENLKESIKEDSDLIDILKNHVKSIPDLLSKMASSSPFDRYPYYKDQLPTISYIKDSLDQSFKFEQYHSDFSGDTINGFAPDPNHDDKYPNLLSNLKDYSPDEYRKNIYPFNSNLYLDYLNQKSFSNDEFKFRGALSVDTVNGFISSKIDPNMWVKDGFTKNLFTNKFSTGYDYVFNNFFPIVIESSAHMLNTTYFHNQLYSDFFKFSQSGKYAGSAYLLLNSLPFKDLEDKIIFDKNVSGIRMSSLFREIGSTHFIPYHLLLKWGSIYHRYKKYILEGSDILNGFLTTNNITRKLNGKLFFDNNTNTTFTITGATNANTETTITYSNNRDIGIHPYYDAIFHQVVNDYTHYNTASGSTSFSSNVNSGGIKLRYRTSINGTRYWTGFVDNTKYDSTISGYTLLPCDGNIVISGITTGTTNEFISKEQKIKKIIWDNEIIIQNFEGRKFPSHLQYNRTYVSGSTQDNKYGIGDDYRKVIDLIATFSPKILNEMEDMFLNFSSELLNEEIPYKRFTKVNYYKFQELLKDISTVKKQSNDSSDPDELINQLKFRQKEKLADITNNILSSNNLIKLTIGNPKEIDAHVYYSFARLNNDNTFSYNSFNTSQVTIDNLKYIDLYLGEDFENKYLKFFSLNDVELKEDNILNFRPLILIFAGYYKDNPNATRQSFLTYLRDNVLNVDSTTKLTTRQTLFLQLLIGNFNKLEKTTKTKKLTLLSGYNDGPLKLEMYNYFKSFNDKWIGGNSIGQKLLMEEFLFFDKANRDIGSQAYFNIQRLIPLDDSRNQKMTLYNAISVLIQGTGFDMRTLPSYVNFYGANDTYKIKPSPSKNIANDLFGTFLEVDYQQSTPKVIIQYTGPTSKHLELSKYSTEYKFMDDSFNIQNVNKNPLIVTTPEVFKVGDLFKSNRVVAFEVSFGDQNQSIFKGVSLDQSSIKNTTESMVAIENLGRSESGSNAYQVDIGLFDIYRQASYTCKVTCMGNVMIQPTMYFYLKNIPMFKGSYWITDVSHSIRGNSISTSFTGTRIPYASLPDPKDSFMSSYKALFDSLINKAVAKVNELNKKTGTEETIKLKNGKTVEVDRGSGTTINGETLVSDSGVNEFGIPFNGYTDQGGLSGKHIQLVEYKGEKWFRAPVVKMSNTGTGGKYEIPDNRDMSIISKLKDVTVEPKSLQWGEIKDLNYEVYSTRFVCPQVVSAEKIKQGTTVFLNPQLNNPTKYELRHEYQLNSNVSTPRFVKGPINIGPNLSVGPYGIAMSSSLMKKLKITKDGEIIYFKIFDSEPTPPPTSTPTPTPTPVPTSGLTPTPTPTGPTPTPTPSGIDQPYNIVTVFAGTYDQATSFILKDQFVGSWKFTDAAYRVISSPCNSTDVVPLSSVWVKPEKVNLNIGNAVDDACPSNNNGGTYSFEYKITLYPILPDGSRDASRSNKNISYVTSVTVDPAESSATINYLGEYNTTQGGDSSYYNIEQNNGKFKVLRIVDTNFNINNVGSTQFRDSSGAIVPHSCSAGSGANTCTVNGKNSGTYTMNTQYYPNGPLNSSPINLVSQPFTQ